MQLKKMSRAAAVGATLLTLSLPAAVHASSHMDAPLITFDDPANTTDVYAFVSKGNGRGRAANFLTTAFAVYPFEEPGLGPNIYRFDDSVRYEINVALDQADLAAGRASVTYRFEFETRFPNQDTTLQAYLGVIGTALDAEGFSPMQNMRQTYSVTKIDNRTGTETVIGTGLRVPPNNQGLVTPLYNRRNNGDMLARGGVSKTANLDFYTRNAINNLPGGYQVFAGQRDDGFYADIHSIFDLDFTFGGADPFNPSPAKPYDGQGGFNVHTMVLNIPFAELGNAKIAGVYGTTSRREDSGDFIQVARQGNPLFNEGLVRGPARKDLYNQTSPTRDAELFLSDAASPELAVVLGTTPLTDKNGNSLLVGIFIPDVIKVDLTTGPARLSGQKGFNRLGVFGGDVLKSEVQDPFGNGGFIPGGWPNGRRFGDDVLDIALLALGAPPMKQGQPVANPALANFDGLTANDITSNTVFPYAATPLNGRNHGHHGEDDGARDGN